MVEVDSEIEVIIDLANDIAQTAYGVVDDKDIAVVDIQAAIVRIAEQKTSFNEYVKDITDKLTALYHEKNKR